MRHSLLYGMMKFILHKQLSPRNIDQLKPMRISLHLLACGAVTAADLAAESQIMIFAISHCFIPCLAGIEAGRT